jgi:hypothetical protein
MTELERAKEQIAFAHGYALRLIEQTDPAEWFRIPTAGVSNIAWQVGHLAFADYRLALLRLRGKVPSDKELIPDEFLRSYGADSVPDADPARQPAPAAIRACFDRVHAEALRVIAAFDPARLGEPIDPPHPIAKTKLESLFWCAAHAMVHAGQIGLLRRQLGRSPLW